MSIVELIANQLVEKKLTKSSSSTPGQEMSSGIQPEIVDHNYAQPSKDDDSETSSSESSSSDSTQDPSFDLEAEESTKSRLRVPPEKFVDSYSSTPKPSPRKKNASPKRLSTSVGRRTKAPVRMRTRRSEGSSVTVFPRPRGMACKECEGCKRDDCGECVYCKDKVKFGGPGKKKQRCLYRVCENMVKVRNLKQGKSTPLTSTPVQSAPDTKDNEQTPQTTFKATPLPEKASPKPAKVDVPVSTSATPISVKATPISSDAVSRSIQALPISDLTRQITEHITQSLITAVGPKPVPIAPKTGTAKSTLSPTKPSIKAVVATSSPAVKATSSTTSTVSAQPAKVTTPIARVIVTQAKPVQQVSPTTRAKLSAAPVQGAVGSSPAKRNSPRATPVTTSSKLVAGWEQIMKCVQCGRERKLSVARTHKFCTQRCIVQWLANHPDKTPKDAVGDSNAPLFSLPALTTQVTAEDKESPKDLKLPRALKNLQIDMAPPGTTLQPSEEKAEDQEKKEEVEVKTTKPVKPAVPDPSKRTRFSQPASSAAKRSVVTPQPSAIKKAKSADKARTESPNGNSKSVKFDLSSTTIASVTAPPPVSYSQSAGSISIVPLDRLSEFVSEQQKNFQESIVPKTDIKIPKGISHSVKDWSIDDVSMYFSSTRECSEFGDIFREQEIDGCALLKLTDHVMCRCLGLPLGKVLKVMAHVNELKKLAFV